MTHSNTWNSSSSSEEDSISTTSYQYRSKKTIRDIPRTNLFKDYHVSIFDCLFQIFDHESSLGNAFEIADELDELNCLESANEVRETAKTTIYI